MEALLPRALQHDSDLRQGHTESDRLAFGAEVTAPANADLGHLLQVKNAIGVLGPAGEFEAAEREEGLFSGGPSEASGLFPPGNRPRPPRGV